MRTIRRPVLFIAALAIAFGLAVAGLVALAVKALA